MFANLFILKNVYWQYFGLCQYVIKLYSYLNTHLDLEKVIDVRKNVTVIPTPAIRNGPIYVADSEEYDVVNHYSNDLAVSMKPIGIIRQYT